MPNLQRYPLTLYLINPEVKKINFQNIKHGSRSCKALDGTVVNRAENS